MICHLISWSFATKAYTSWQAVKAVANPQNLQAYANQNPYITIEPQLHALKTTFRHADDTINGLFMSTAIICSIVMFLWYCCLPGTLVCAFCCEKCLEGSSSRKEQPKSADKYE